jgi:hypothetical protein
LAAAITYTAACSLLAASPAPVLFVDTCIFLDIVRAPIRELISAESAKFAQNLCARSSGNPRSLWLVTSETAWTEWNENIAEVVNEVEREIRRIESKRKHFISAAQAISNCRYQYGQSEGALNLPSASKISSKRLLDACLVISPDNDHLIKAMNRVKQYVPPARRGKSEAKDCEIFELFLGLCKNSRTAGSADQFVFASSNTKDYGTDNAGGIQAELNCVNAKYVSDLPWAIAAIDGRA